MKALTIDIGNTSIKYATFVEREMQQHGRIVGHDVDALVAELHDTDITHCICCSTRAVDTQMHSRLMSVAPQVMILNHTTRIPIRNLYRTPQTLGMDRLAAVVGAYHITKADTLVIDMGTAITYDFITSKGEYMGGNIAPGIDMRLQALHQHTALLPLVTATGRRPDIGEDTETAIRCGVLDGTKYEIEGYISKLSLKYPNLCVFITGGDLIYFDIDKKMRTFAEQFLVLRGLNEILLYNVEG